MDTIPQEIANTEDLIDSREVIQRIAWLEETEDRTEEETKELAALIALAERGESSPDWQYGEILIRESYFVTYAQDFADDIGAIPDHQDWPTYCIDWERAARELQMDYTVVDFAGVDYFIRA